jgi:hypothetical protein
MWMVVCVMTPIGLTGGYQHFGGTEHFASIFIPETLAVAY